jgi:hypothetical protein
MRAMDDDADPYLTLEEAYLLAASGKPGLYRAKFLSDLHDFLSAGKPTAYWLLRTGELLPIPAAAWLCDLKPVFHRPRGVGPRGGYAIPADADEQMFDLALPDAPKRPPLIWPKVCGHTVLLGPLDIRFLRSEIAAIWSTKKASNGFVAKKLKKIFLQIFPPDGRPPPREKMSNKELIAAVKTSTACKKLSLANRPGSIDTSILRAAGRRK